ncbi:MAG TPA: AMP-binding protein [Gaiellaceae bacterium]|nr:AMP-binding protein [Gaiellaceae bacterium]
MKGLRIGRRRERDAEAALSPLERALRPALVDGRWQIPDRFNFTRDVVDALARDPKRRALTFLGSDGVIEPRSFLEISEGATVCATRIRERGVSIGDRVIIMAGSTVDWLEAVLGVWKAGAVVVPCTPTATASQLERLVSSTDAALILAARALEPTIGRMGFTPEVELYDEGVKRNSKDVPTGVATHDTASRDLAFVISTSGVGGSRKDVAHTHGSVFATRVQAEHWLDVGRGDAVWCTSETTSPLTMWNTVVGPWSRGAEIVLQHGDFDADERLDLLFRLGPSILCQSPAEYRALAEHPKLERFRSPRLRRLVSTGDYLDPEVVAAFEERWGMSIADGYGQAETNVVVANLADGAVKPGSFGRAMPGHHVAVIDDQGNELPAGVEGDLAVRGRPPTLFAGYWELPEETKSAFLGDWYLTGDVAHADEEGFFTFVGRADDVITSNGRTFGPYDVERVLDGHPALAATAVVGIRDLQRGGHFVRAFVVPKDGAEGSEQLEAELRQYAAQTLPSPQVPREIVFVDDLPMVSSKISRHELRERPLAGRPLWEMPPTTEPDEAPKPAPPPFDGEFSPRVETQTALEPEAVAAEPPVLPEPTVTFEPIYLPEPVALPPAEEPAPMPEPVVTETSVPVVEPASEPEQAPEPPAVEPAPQLVEPEPVVAEVLQDRPAAAETEPESERTVAQAVPEPAPLVTIQPELHPEPEPRDAPEPEPEPEPEPVAEQESATPLVLLPAPDPSVADEPSPATELAVAELQELPDYVVGQPEEVAPVVVPDPEPEPDLSGPLPEFVVEPDASEPAASAHIEPASEPEPEPEEDLGPLPDYIIDPTKPREAHRQPPPPPPEPEPTLTPRPVSPAVPRAQPAGLNFPSAAAFSIPRPDPDAPDLREPRAPRPRPQAELGKSKRSTESAEPGDEGHEVSWMEGLSNRLSAYSLSEDEGEPVSESDDDTID